MRERLQEFCCAVFQRSTGLGSALMHLHGQMEDAAYGPLGLAPARAKTPAVGGGFPGSDARLLQQRCRCCSRGCALGWVLRSVQTDTVTLLESVVSPLSH
mmetsp:Transcript_47967/g.95440  ORF Transcript_47967/g.95440 Transcript_47967/m.95440 type:complete len:100 (+) Transcript_47967:140-439(+)